MIKNNENFSSKIRSNTQALLEDFNTLKTVSADLPHNEKAYRTLPRSEKSWRLPGGEKNKQRNFELLMLPVRDEYYTHNAYLAVVPQPIVLHRQVAKLLEDYARSMFAHFPAENTLARREYGVPMLIGRFDVIVDKAGNIQICELDDVCSLWPALPKINPIAESYLKELEIQLGRPIYTAELFQYADGPAPVSPLVRKEFARVAIRDDLGVEHTAYIPRNVQFPLAIFSEQGLSWRLSQSNTDHDAAYYEDMLKRTYLHNEDHWHGDINDAWFLDGKILKLDDVALSIRAFRDMPGFKEHLDRFGPRSITMAWERDSKWSLVAENLAVMAANLDVAVAFGKIWEAGHPGELLVFKTLYSARTDHTAIFSAKGTKLKGMSSASQIRKKFGDASNGPIVIQPYKEPDSLETAGISFIGTEAENFDKKSYTDRKIICNFNHIGSDSPGERVIAGMENHFSMIFRSFVVYLPKEKRLVHIGGMWQATDGRIVHGGAHSVAGPLYIDGLMRHPNSKDSIALGSAEAMIKSHM
jgi:hypothetical protein